MFEYDDLVFPRYRKCNVMSLFKILEWQFKILYVKNEVASPI